MLTFVKNVTAMIRSWQKLLRESSLSTSVPHGGGGETQVGLESIPAD